MLLGHKAKRAAQNHVHHVFGELILLGQEPAPRKIVERIAYSHSALYHDVQRAVNYFLEMQWREAAGR
jgi:hypothetical protein